MGQQAVYEDVNEQRRTRRSSRALTGRLELPGDEVDTRVVDDSLFRGRGETRPVSSRGWSISKKSEPTESDAPHWKKQWSVRSSSL